MEIPRMALALLMIAAPLGCAARPVVDLSKGAPDRMGTLTGSVRGPEGAAGEPGEALAGRKVEAVEVTSGVRHSVVTAQNGGYTLLIPPGDYRVQVELRAGESLQKQPETIHLGSGDVDSRANLVIVSAR